MKIIVKHDASGEEISVEINVTNQTAEFVDNKGNELYQPKTIRRIITGTLKTPNSLWREYLNFCETMSSKRFSVEGIDYFKTGPLIIDNDNYANDNIFLNVTNNIVRILACETPLVEEETNFNEGQYFDRVRERNSGNQRIKELIEKLQHQASGAISEVTYNDVREGQGNSREAQFNDMVPQAKCKEMIGMLESELNELNNIN